MKFIVIYEPKRKINLFKSITQNDVANCDTFTLNNIMVIVILKFLIFISCRIDVFSENLVKDFVFKNLVNKEVFKRVGYLLVFILIVCQQY